MDDKRIKRISEEVKKVVSDLISNELKDPRIFTMTSITHVEVTRDLRYAKIYISVLGNEVEKNDTIEGLENAKGFIRREIGNRIKLRYVPEPIFNLDDSIEQSIYISKLIDKVNKENQKRKENNND